MKKETRMIMGICIILVLAAGALFVGQQKRTAGAGGEIILADELGMSAAGGEILPSAVPSGTPVDTIAQECAVYVSGAVKHPGLYRYRGTARVSDAVDAVGGFSKNADRDAVNLARPLSDGEQILVPVKETAGKKKNQEPSAGALTVGEQGKKLIDINTASSEELMTLPGIGEAKARLIIAYRTEQGPFARPEDLMKISGIKEGVYNKIKDLISV